MDDADVHKVVSKGYFDHIKWGGPCPPLNVTLAEVASDENYLPIDQESLALLLAQYMDEIHGTEDIVCNRRKVILVDEYIRNSNNKDFQLYTGGSLGDGFCIITSDIDLMCTCLDKVITHPEHIHCIDTNSAHKIILLMRKANCRPGYVFLELFRFGNASRCAIFVNAFVSIGHSIYVSSDIYRQGLVDFINKDTRSNMAISNGPCMTNSSPDIDCALAVPCICWPKEADEWIQRTRLHGWPAQTMIDQIVQAGCHLVPVGDKCSTDTLLQWRISFARAERLLVHSLTHPQFRVYGILKYFLIHIKDLLDHITGDRDILCSYFIKTVIFFAVENSPTVLWHDKNTFLCFRFCLSILIAWVKSGYCPNYFIQKNNLFLRKVHGENRQKLLHFLRDCYDLKWPRMFLSVESIHLMDMEMLLRTSQSISCSQYRESARDLDLFRACLSVGSYKDKPMERLCASLGCLAVSEADVDDFIAYYATAHDLENIANRSFTEYNTTGSNKQNYRALRKSKRLLTPQASMCTSPGLMMLATFHYLTGNYSKALEMCANLISPLKLYIPTMRERSRERYQNLYCGKDYSFYHKLRAGTYSVLTYNEQNIGLCLPHLHSEVINSYPYGIVIPPLPYATFLSVLCYHDLGDIRRRDTELINLRAVSYDPEQGGHNYWIVHTLLGICYQTVGDNRRAIRSFTESLRVMPENNPAKVRIESLQSSQ